METFGRGGEPGVVGHSVIYLHCGLYQFFGDFLQTVVEFLEMDCQNLTVYGLDAGLRRGVHGKY